MSNQVHSQNFSGGLTRFIGCFHNLDSAAFSAAASVDLGFDNDSPAQFFGDTVGVFGILGEGALRNGDSELFENFFTLVFVNFHDEGWR